jgi:5-bromo-4-chloroindolyl phosphate hydrolysis protein
MNTKNDLTSLFTGTKSYVKEKINSTNIKAKLENTKNELKDLGTTLSNALNQTVDQNINHKPNHKPKQQKCQQIGKSKISY